jgi:hypothetical protein
MSFRSIVSLHYIYEDAENVHLVQDLAEGHTLLDLVIEQETLGEARSARIVFKIL